MTTNYRHTEPCRTADLRTLFLFEELTDAQLAQLCGHAHIEVYDPGSVIEEGEDAVSFMVLMDGEIAVSKRVGDRDVETNRTAHRGTFCGAVAAYLDKPHTANPFSVRATTPCRFAVIEASAFATFMRTQFPMAVHMLQGMWGDNEGMHTTLDYQNRIRAAGKIAAGLAHGLNNPAAATVRAAAELRTRLTRLARDTQPSAAARTALAPLLDDVVRRIDEQSRTPARCRPAALDVAGKEDELADWLDEHGVLYAWDIAAGFVAAGLDVDRAQSVLDTLRDADADDSAELIFTWLAQIVEAEQSINDITEAGQRISELVDASAHYSHLDGSAFDVVDLHKLLDSTMDVLAPALGNDIAVIRDYDPTLPGVPCYPSELTQAFTHIVSNAVDALRGGESHGRTLILRTANAEDAITVEFIDNGPGIDPAIRDHIFEPFFTTKEVGEGAGLGLNVAWRIIADRHGGTLTMRCLPRDTTFLIRLPPVHVEAC